MKFKVGDGIVLKKGVPDRNYPWNTEPEKLTVMGVEFNEPYGEHIYELHEGYPGDGFMEPCNWIDESYELDVATLLSDMFNDSL